MKFIYSILKDGNKDFFNVDNFLNKVGDINRKLFNFDDFKFLNILVILCLCVFGVILFVV